jgi:copper transport protein
MRRLVSRVAVALFLGVLATMSVPAPASAHAYLATSAPADGTVLDRAPEVLVLSFTEHVELPSTQMDIVDGDGRHWAITGLVLRPGGSPDGAAETGTESPVEIVAALPALPANTYHVAWRTLSSDDLHPTTGTAFPARMGRGSASRCYGGSGWWASPRCSARPRWFSWPRCAAGARPRYCVTG